MSSLRLVQRTQPKGPPPAYRDMAHMQGETLAYHATRGYWIVRLLEATQAGLLRELLSKRRSPKEIELRVAELVHVSPDGFWAEIDDVLLGYFAAGGVYGFLVAIPPPGHGNNSGTQPRHAAGCRDASAPRSAFRRLGEAHLGRGRAGSN